MKLNTDGLSIGNPKMAGCVSVIGDDRDCQIVGFT